MLFCVLIFYCLRIPKIYFHIFSYKTKLNFIDLNKNEHSTFVSNSFYKINKSENILLISRKNIHNCDHYLNYTHSEKTNLKHNKIVIDNFIKFNNIFL